MKKAEIIHAWKDRRYRESLSAPEAAFLPDHPAGYSRLEDDELALVIGSGPTCSDTAITCLPDSTNPSAVHTDCSACPDCPVENRV